jgi:hypothetical protein
MSERSVREIYQAIIGAVAAADQDALNHLINEDIVDHHAVPGQVPRGREVSERGRDLFGVAQVHVQHQLEQGDR